MERYEIHPELDNIDRTITVDYADDGTVYEDKEEGDSSKASQYQQYAEQGKAAMSKLQELGDKLGPLFGGKDKGDKLAAQMRPAFAETLKPYGFPANMIGYMANTALPAREALSNPEFINNSMNDMSYATLRTFPTQLNQVQLNYLRGVAQSTTNAVKPFHPEPFNNYQPSNTPGTTYPGVTPFQSDSSIGKTVGSKIASLTGTSISSTTVTIVVIVIIVVIGGLIWYNRK